jgi:hypothetical protein
MANHWVYKPDGTIQCDETERAIPLEEMRVELGGIIGAAEVLRMEKRAVATIRMCGMPAGAVNAYEITEEGWTLLSSGTVGRRGFHDWPEEEEPRGPATVRELIGRPVRVYRRGDPVTMDHRPERVDVETDDSNVIVGIRFG